METDENDAATEDSAVEETAVEESAVEDAAIYDFVHPEHKIKSTWPVLNLISKNMAADFEVRLHKRFQFSIGVESEEAQKAKFKDIFDGVDDAKLLFEVTLLPLLGNAWLSIDRSLVYELAEAFFGGTSESTDTVRNPVLSHTERRLCQYFTNCLQESLPPAWSMVLDLHNPVIERLSLDSLNNSSDDQVVVECKYAVCIAEKRFELQLIYSHSMLEPYQKTLQKIKRQTTEISDGFSRALQEELMNCEIDLQAVLAETKISLAEFMELKPGDFIPLKEIENVSVKSNSKPLFDAKVGKSNGQLSARLSRWYESGLS